MGAWQITGVFGARAESLREMRNPLTGLTKFHVRNLTTNKQALAHTFWRRATLSTGASREAPVDNAPLLFFFAILAGALGLTTENHEILV